MQPTLEIIDGVSVLRPHDALAGPEVDGFKRFIEEMNQDSPRVVLDLEDVTFIDSSGCGALVLLSRRVSLWGGSLKICNLQPSVRALFELLRLNRVMEVYPSRERAMAAFHLEKAARAKERADKPELS